jgi:hypothetical protein
MKHIGIHAPARSGKSTVAQMLKEALPEAHVVEIALADPMKRIIQSLFGVGYDALWGPSELRNTIPDGSKSSVRVLLQTLGTEWGRAHREDLWVNQLLVAIEQLNEGDLGFVGLGMKRYSKEEGVVTERFTFDPRPLLVVTPDVRFENEASILRAKGFEIWHLWRPLPDAPQEAWRAHASEGGVQRQERDFVLENTGTLNDLRAQVAQHAARLRGLHATRRCLGGGGVWQPPYPP